LERFLEIVKKLKFFKMKYPVQAAQTAFRPRFKGKALFTGFLALIFSAFTVSCEGPQGPPGLNGLDGVNILGSVFEVQGTFTPANEFSLLFEFPNTLEVFETDVVLVYLLWDVTSDGNGQDVDIWRLLPQTRIVDQGLLQYNYDFTFFDVNIFLETDFDPALLLPGDTDNQVFRVAVLPADIIASSRVDVNEFNQVMSLIGASEADVQTISIPAAK
jgi:hypothetical protein